MERRRLGLDRRRVPRGGRRPGDRPGRHPTVLVADSYESARRPCVRYLDLFNFDVVEAGDGEEALSKIVARPPRVILIEWALPAMPVPRLSQWLAQRWRTSGIPVIVIASTDEPQIAGAAVAGVLMKPFPLKDMLEEVRRVLRLTCVE